MGPYESNYFRNFACMVGIVLTLLVLYSAMTGLARNSNQSDPLTDPKYKQYRDLFNKSAKTEVFKD